MKKSSLFVMLVLFIVSFFGITFFGLSVRDNQFRIRFDDAKITGFIRADNGEEIDYQVILAGKTQIKLLVLDFPQEEGMLKLYIKKQLTPDPSNVTDAEAFEFTIDERGNDEYVDENGNTRRPAVISEQPKIGELTIRTHAIEFYKPCKITLRLRTTDGSSHTDVCRITLLDKKSSGGESSISTSVI